MISTLFLKIGTIIMNIETSDPLLADRLVEEFQISGSPAQPVDFTVNIEVKKGLISADSDIDFFDWRPYTTQNKFSYWGGTAKGEMIRQSNEVFITVDEELVEDRFFTLKALLVKAYYYALATKYHRADEFLVHASCIAKDGKAYVFCGESGGGKTTICRMMAKRANVVLLNDEVSVLRKDGESDIYYASGSPFRGEFEPVLDRSFPLGGVFFLKKSRSLSIKRLTGFETFKRLLSAIIFSGDLLSNDGFKVASYRMDLAANLSANAKFYVLCFHKNGNIDFWHSLKEGDPNRYD